MAQTFNSDIAVLGTLEAALLGNNIRDYITGEINDCKNECVSLADENAAERIETVTAKIARLEGSLDALTAKYNEAISRFNAAIEAVNGMAERLASLEANYDPTIIK